MSRSNALILSMKISALIIDDEPLSRKLIINLLASVSEIEVTEQCKTGREAIEIINKLSPDLIFLDIKLKDMTGFDVLEKISIKVPLVIFVTAFDSFAIKAFDFFAFDYLLKPFNEDRFYKSVNRAIENFKIRDTGIVQENIKDFLNHLRLPETTADNNKKIPVSLGNKTTFVYHNDILYISASSYYVEIYTEKSKYLHRDSMYNLLNELNSNDFIRIHRSTIINLGCVHELVNFNYGIGVRMTDLKQFRVSKSYKKEFLIKMGLHREKISR